jgi:hypothetical protein
MIATVLTGLAVPLLLGSPAASAAEVCYQDEQGRIVERRRPGYRQVPCPVPGETVDAAPDADASTPGYQRRADARRSETESQQTRPLVAERQPNPASPVPRPGLADYVGRVPMPDRWRIVNALGYPDRWWDPYNQNTIKADRPVHGEWFFNVGVISDTFYELRDVPTPVGLNSTGDPGQLDVFGSADQWALFRIWPRNSSTTRATPCSGRRTGNSASRRCSTYNYTELTRSSA